jgi:hypothetical protein
MFVGVLGISSAWCLHIFGCRDIFRFIANHCRVVTTLRTTYNVTSSLPAEISKETIPKKLIGKKILGTLWDSLDDKSIEEHRLVQRLYCYVRLIRKKKKESSSEVESGPVSTTLSCTSTRARSPRPRPATGKCF